MMEPPAFPLQFRNLVYGLLQFDPAKRTTLLEARKAIDDIESPSPLELLSFYSHVVPSSRDAGWLTMKAMCQLNTGSIPIAECVSTLRDALQATASFPPALLLLHLICSASLIPLVALNKDEKRGIARVLTGRASFTSTSVDFKRAIISRQPHRSTLPELMMTALWLRFLSQADEVEEKQNSVQLQLKKVSSLDLPKIWATLLQNCTALSREDQMWSDKISACSYGCHPRNEMMMKALLEWELGHTASAIDLVAQAYAHFNSEQKLSEDDMCLQQQHYLPGLIFLCGLSFVSPNQEQLGLQQIPAELFCAFSRANSTPTDEFCAFCKAVLVFNRNTPIVEEWRELLYAATFGLGIKESKHKNSMEGEEEDLSVINFTCDLDDNRCSIQTSWACMFFVALWLTYSSDSSSTPILDLLSSKTCTAVQPPQAFLPVCTTILASGNQFGDLTKAVTLLEVAKEGYPFASACLAVNYEDGEGVPKDPHKAFTLRQRAADGFCTAGLRALARHFEEGKCVTKDPSKAVELYKRAANAGECDAMIRLAEAYVTGDCGLEKDATKAVPLLKMAANAGATWALRDLASLYQLGEGGLAQDTNRAIALFKKAAGMGDTLAMFALASLYEDGHGDIHEAVLLLQRAAEAGETMGLHNLAMKYWNGEGVEEDRKKAVALWQRAAEDRDEPDPKAMVTLAGCYEAGQELCKDVRTAMKFYRLAVDSGYDDEPLNDLLHLQPANTP
ncbi:SEL1 protein [Pelomyxa schiedti]|nr:SEL1 protein [Pelomyxa schiedti]